MDSANSQRKLTVRPALIELASVTLEPLLDEVVFVGAAAIPVWITDESVLPLRATDDTDCVVAVSTKSEYDGFSERLRRLEMREDSESKVICRWRAHGSDLVIDVMPSNQSIIGFDGKWLRAVPDDKRGVALENGLKIWVVSPVLLLILKMEAFSSRGNDDYFASKDFEDIVKFVEGRPELVDEVLDSDDEQRAFVLAFFEPRIEDPQFQAGVEGAIIGPESGSRAEAVISRFRQMI